MKLFVQRLYTIRFSSPSSSVSTLTLATPHQFWTHQLFHWLSLLFSNSIERKKRILFFCVFFLSIPDEKTREQTRTLCFDWDLLFWCSQNVLVVEATVTNIHKAFIISILPVSLRSSKHLNFPREKHRISIRTFRCAKVFRNTREVLQPTHPMNSLFLPLKWCEAEWRRWRGNQFCAKVEKCFVACVSEDLGEVRLRGIEIEVEFME